MDVQLAIKTAQWFFLDNLNDGVAIFTQDGTFVYANPSAKELLPLPTHISTLRDIYEENASYEAWETWERLLTSTHDIYLKTNLGYLFVQSRLAQWDGRDVVQLILNASPYTDVLPNEQSPEMLHAYIEELRRENRRLSRHSEQVEYLTVISEASQKFSHSDSALHVLTTLGESMLRLVNGFGYSVYLWEQEQTFVSLALDYVHLPQQQLRTDIGQYEVVYHRILKQLLDENTLLVLESGRSLPGTPIWSQSSVSHYVILLSLFVGGRPYGVLALGLNGYQNELDEHAIQFLATQVNQASVALEKAQLFSNVREREQFLESLGRVSLAINGTLNYAKVLQLICHESREIFGVDGAYIWQMRDGDSQEFVGIAANGLGDDGFAGLTMANDDDHLFVHYVSATGKSVYINNMERNRDYTLRIPDADSVKAVLGSPLIRQGVTIGVLLLVSREKSDMFGSHHLANADSFAVQAAIALRNADLVTRLRTINDDLDRRVASRTKDLGSERDRFQTLLRINNELASTLDEDRVLTRALELVNDAVQASHGTILLIDGTSNDLIYRGVLGPDLVALQGQPSGLKKSDSVVGWIIEHEEPILIHDFESDGRWPERPLLGQGRSLLGAPLLFNQEVIGAMILWHDEPRMFTNEQLRLVTGAATQFSTMLYNAHLYQLVSSQAGRLSGMLRTEQVGAAKNQAMLESIADGVLVSDENGTIIIANDALADILAMPKHRALGRDVAEFSGLYGMSDGVWHETIQAWAVGDSPTSRQSLEDTMSLDDDNKIVRVHLAPVFVDGVFFGTVSIFRDITKDVEVDRVKTEFVSTVSHELRTPLTSIKGYTDLMLMGATGPLVDGATQYLQVIKNNADRLQELVNDLLDISRIETGKTELNLRPMDVGQVIKRVVNEHLTGRIKHDEKDILAIVELDDSLPLVNADEKRVTQIITNLVDNAFNYTPEGGRITISAVRDKSFVTVSVIDTGIGMSQEVQDKIFERFYRSDDYRVQRVSGTGLGLAIVKSLVEMHGGKLDVKSVIGTGSTFRFNLPQVIEEGQLI